VPYPGEARRDGPEPDPNYMSRVAWC